jgi:isocitrate dehydrogenase
MMLVHLGQCDVATTVHNALLRTLEDGVHTGDIFTPEQSQSRVTTEAFADAVIARLGQQPQQLKPVHYEPVAAVATAASVRRPAKKEIVGVDVFLQWTGGAPAELAEKLQPTGIPHLPLTMITNRGVKVWPQGFPETFCTDHWRCRFQNDAAVSHADILQLLERVAAAGFDFIKTENLCTFDGKPGYSLGQGQ